MTYEQFIHEIETHGFTEANYHRYYAFSQLEGIREADDATLMSLLLNGGLHFTPQYIKDAWDPNNFKETTEFFLEFMKTE